MNKSLHFAGLSDLCNHIVELVGKRTRGKLDEKPPCSFEDVQDQMRAVVRFMQLSDSYREKDSYWLATAYLTENLKYYSSSCDMGKCGHILLEVADCLFSCKEVVTSTACCHEAIALLIRSRDDHDWARGMAAIGELLLVAVELNTTSSKEAAEALRRVRSTLSIKERRMLSSEDAHKVSRKLIKAYKLKTDEPLKELERIPPRRKRTEEKNLQSLLIEWIGHYNTVRSSVERISPEITRNLPKKSEA